MHLTIYIFGDVLKRYKLRIFEKIIKTLKLLDFGIIMCHKLTHALYCGFDSQIN